MQLNALVLDDDSDVVTIVRDVLASNNFQASGYCNPEEALKDLKKMKFDVIITDLMMPNMDGFEFIFQVRTMGIKIPVIALTGLMDQGESLFAQGDGKQRARPDVCLSKPFTYSSFYETFNSIVDKLEFAPQ